ncbi:MAG: F0F1 ATP synthase subunit gamma [Acidimicrobiia bacterium]|nr:F0F1 ATP synthase subunit gamma [Acidimicrobiia bacterium]
MAGGQERILRGRIRSVQGIKKITRAMELIAASRIVKAQQRVQAAVPYSEKITEVVKDLAVGGAGGDLPLLAGRAEVKTVCYVAVTADRGLAGGYNAGVQRATEGEIKADHLRGDQYVIIPVGRKAEGYFRFRGYTLGQPFNGFSDNPTYAHAREIGEHVIDLFQKGEVDRVELVYTRFISAGSQEVVLRPLVPLSVETIAGGDGRPTPAGDGPTASYEFEPDPASILDTLLPRYVEARIYAALLNAAAAEHAFRQRAMKSATDNAEDLIKTLSRIMNRARQDSITTEIMEIVSGAEALGGDRDVVSAAQLVDIDAMFGRFGGDRDGAADVVGGDRDGGGSVATLERDDRESLAAPVGRFGPGTADATDDGAGPDGWDIKGNADSMLFHTTDSPWYGRTKAEVWFDSEDSARAAGFTRWDERDRNDTSTDR